MTSTPRAPEAAAVVSTVSVILDLPFDVPHLPERGGDVLGASHPPTPGGGANVVLAAARQGARTALLSPLGDGPNGRVCAAALAAEGVELLLGPGSVVGLTGPRDTGVCVTLVEPDGERTFLTSPGVEAALTRDLLTTAQRTSARPAAGDVVVVSGYDLAYPGGQALATWVAALASDITVVLDPGPLVGEIPADVRHAVVPRADVLTLNEREARLLGGVATLRDVPVVVLRLGARGCEVHRDGRVVAVPSIGVTALDSTGAGDAHTGVLAAELAAGTDLLDAVRRANVAGAVTASRRGPATCPTRAEIDALLRASGERTDEAAGGGGAQ